MLKIGIIGCGKIADQHAEEIRRIANCEIAGVCDSEPLMAKQMYERFPVKGYFSDVHQMLETAQPDVMHITTPPHSHYTLGKLCLDAGCHIYMEKPFTLNTTEAEDLIRIAEEKNLKITVGHNVQFTLAARRMRRMVREGYLGEGPIHMDSYYCYNLDNPSYAKALLGDKNHWVRRLPGKLLHNIINHGVSKVAEFIQCSSPKVIAYGFSSPLLKSINEKDIIDELRVIISDENNCTAYFTFSSQMRPVLHQLRLYGTKNALIVDDDHETLIRVNGSKYKSYLDQVIPPFNFAKQYLASSAGNIKRFFRKELYMNSGMRFLIHSFYRSISENEPLPINYREILLTSRIMDDIFMQVNSDNSHSLTETKIGKV
jgi:predicted dehydrogenase